MKLFAKIAFCLAVAIGPQSAVAQSHVDGYVRRDGVYVPPHYRSNPDGNRLNNWSVQPNVNPYTGQQGTQNPYANPYGTGRQGNDLNPYRNRYR